LQFVRAGAAVRRFHAVHTLQTETVGHHSHGVAMLCYTLAEGTPSAELLLAALTHDLAEQIYGDIPAPTKRALNISAACAQLEDDALASRGLQFDLTLDERRILKLADLLDAMGFCVRERQLGNQLMAPIYARYRAYFDATAHSTDAEAHSLFNELHRHWERAHNGQ
jgi:5'-deoxynucleotidase YfbR-like HD superfamily hydrolase